MQLIFVIVYKIFLLGSKRVILFVLGNIKPILYDKI